MKHTTCWSPGGNSVSRTLVVTVLLHSATQPLPTAVAQMYGLPFFATRTATPKPSQKPRAVKIHHEGCFTKTREHGPR